MEIVAKRTLFEGPKFDFAMHDIRTAGGEMIERGFIDHPGSVLMIPVLPDGRLVMVRQFRHPCRERFLELPAGTAHRGEPLETTAVRELAEETGYRTARMERMADVYPLPGLTNERMTYFLCLDLTPGPVQREIDEDMEVEVLSLEEALTAIDAGAIPDGKTIIGLWMYARRSIPPNVGNRA